jgi:hypothetical protein
MKIKNIIKYKNKLLKLKLIKTKIYKKKDQLTNTRIEDIEYRLKKPCMLFINTIIIKDTFIGVPVHRQRN